MKSDVPKIKLSLSLSEQTLRDWWQETIETQEGRKAVFVFLLLYMQKSAENKAPLYLQYEILYFIKPDAWNNGGTTDLARSTLGLNAIIIFLQKAFISFQWNHRNIVCLHYLLQSLISYSLITYMRQEIQITKLRWINETENYFLLFAALCRKRCMYVPKKLRWASALSFPFRTENKLPQHRWSYVSWSVKH